MAIPKPKSKKKFHEHWEKTYDNKVPNNAKNQMMGSCFNPVNTRERYKTYIPINETDT